jgi:hypothetical protein
LQNQQWWRDDTTLREKHVVLDYNNKLIMFTTYLNIIIRFMLGMVNQLHPSTLYLPMTVRQVINAFMSLRPRY